MGEDQVNLFLRFYRGTIKLLLGNMWATLSQVIGKLLQHPKTGGLGGCPLPPGGGSGAEPPKLKIKYDI